MTGSLEITAGLIALTRLTSKVHDQLHDQEHFWESLEYGKLEDVWDEANRAVWDKIHHKLLRRAYALGGRPEGVSDNAEDAYRNAIEGLNEVHRECQKLYDFVEADDDYVTERILMKAQKQVEDWITYFEAKLAQVRKLESTAFMSEQM